MPKRYPLERRQRILQDLLDGVTSKEIAEKYNVGINYANKLYREAYGIKQDLRIHLRIQELEQRLATQDAKIAKLEQLLNLFFKQRLQLALKGKTQYNNTVTKGPQL